MAQLVNYSNLVDQFYYDGYSAFHPEREVEEQIEEDSDQVFGVFVNGKPVRRSEFNELQDV